MDFLPTLRRYTLASALLLLAGCLLAWFFLPYKAFLAGMMLGMLTSLYNILQLARRLRIAGEWAVVTGGRKGSGLGSLNRYLMVILAVFILYRFPSYFGVLGFMLGLPVCYLLPLAVNFFMTDGEREVKKGDGNHAQSDIFRSHL
jgi:ATP synthase protein I